MYNKISAKEAKLMMDTEYAIVILDVRTKKEYDQGHVHNSISIPLNNLSDEVEKKIPNKDQTILVYCNSGNRSKIASSLLGELGYTQIYDFGGIVDWKFGLDK